MKLFTMTFAASTIIMLLSCNCDNDPSQQKVTMEESIQWVNVSGRNTFTIPTLVVTPEGVGPFPAIVVLHGCGGLVKDPVTKVLESHFQSWVNFGKENKVVMIFPDSFNPRGFGEFCSYAPPEDAICSPAYERPHDVAAILLWLATQNYIDTNRLGVLGFSHGGSTVISSLADTDFLTLKEREVTNNGISYTVPGPVEMPKEIRFKAGVAYYPGAGFYGYFNDQYLPNSPLLIHAASLDSLYTSGSTEKLVQAALTNGASAGTGNNIELHVYDEVSHSFDGALSGANAQADQLAKQRTIDWFKKYLKF